MGCRWLFLLVITTGCNSWFYHPDSFLHDKPSRHGIDFSPWTTKTSDGVRLQGWTLKAKNQPPRGTVIHFHGNAQNRSAHFLFVAWLVSYGYQVEVFDYRGYGGSDGKATRQGLVIDGSAVIDRICKNRPHPVFLVAQSLGGAVAIPALQQAKDPCPCALVLDSTFSSYRSITRQKLADFWLTWPLQYPLSYLISDELSPIDHVQALHGLPVIMIHGDQDTIVPISEGARLYEKISSREKHFWQMEDGRHTEAFVGREALSYRQQLVDALEKFGESSNCH